MKAAANAALKTPEDPTYDVTAAANAAEATEEEALLLLDETTGWNDTTAAGQLSQAAYTYSATRKDNTDASTPQTEVRNREGAFSLNSAPPELRHKTSQPAQEAASRDNISSTTAASRAVATAANSAQETASPCYSQHHCSSSTCCCQDPTNTRGYNRPKPH